jgi:S-adenosylmethionine:tRNA ribosyltransferase-isomerase
VNPDLSDFLADYHFELPEELIAQEPSAKRSEARLLLVRRDPPTGLPRFEDLSISDLPALVRETPQLRDSLWLRNRSRVLPARFYAKRPSGSRHEIVLLEETSPGLWSALMRNSAKMHFPQELFVDGLPPGEEQRILCPSPGVVDVRSLKQPLSQLLSRVGEMPLPPYIKKREAARDQARYQPVWALQEHEKSVAAPTASLHFTDELLSSLEKSGVEFADSVLHVGLGTFEPVRCERLSEHELHDERIYVDSKDFHKLDERARAKRPILCVGTTALRCLESLPLAGHSLRPEVRCEQTAEASISGRTRLFVKPGFEFRFTSALLTNFHLPESTLFVLVATFADSRTLAQEAYAHAVANRYRFFSYGDASLWI